MKTLDEKKKERFLLLHKMYEKTDQSGLQLLQLEELARELGLNRVEALVVADYLANEGLIRIFNDEANIVAINHKGVVEIEAALSAPTKGTEHFLPLNFIYVEQMNNSQIMQASEGGFQAFILGDDRIENLREFLETFNKRSDELSFNSAEDRKELEAEVATITAQIESPRPKYQIVATSIQSITNILEGFSGSVLATMLIELLKR